MATQSQKLGYVPALDGLRGVAILLVICNHYFGLLGGGYMGVQLFFVLSGFLITSILMEEMHRTGIVNLRQFYARRARRLFPALFVLLIVYLGVTADFRVVALAGLYDGNLVQAFITPNPLAGSGLAHLWSLAMEEQFYLVWPVILLVVARSRHAFKIVAGLLILALAYRGLLAYRGDNLLRLYYGPDTRADGLLAGCMLALTRWRPREPLILAGFCMCAVGTMIEPAARASLIVVAPFLVVGCVLLVAAATTASPMAQLLSARALVSIGKVSYSLYLWHIPIYAALGHSEPFVALPLSFAAAWASYRFVEQPFRHRRTKPVAVEPALAVT
jgi:peptidoglycan/LPS O-acetylase OafA/YrhL